jgi:putative glutamine amidotransferase
LVTPLIGITTFRTLSRNNFPTIGVNEAYVQSVSQADGTPVLIPLGLPEPTLVELLPRLDGIIFTGGGDVHPARYGNQPHTLVNSVDEDRDRVEIALFRAAYDRRMPFLGICRGLQLVNVALGGSLYEDLLAQNPQSIKHDFFSDQAPDYLAHPVTVEQDTHLAGILGATRLEVNSLHHQGIRHLAGRLQAIAHAPDGLIEAVQVNEYPFGLAVQWHPEWMQAHLAMRAVFNEFVRACSR